MATSSIWTVLISCAALAVSIYGVTERRRDIQRQLIIRVSELVDELNRITYDLEARGEVERLPNYKGGSVLATVADSRRELLCSEIETLGARLKGGLSSPQQRVLGSNWARAGRPGRSIAIFKSVVESEPQSSLDAAYAVRGLAAVLMVYDDEAAGRDAYEESIERLNRHSEIGPWEVALTYYRWAIDEEAIGELQDARTLLGKAETQVMHCKDLRRRTRMVKAVAEARRNLGKA